MVGDYSTRCWCNVVCLDLPIHVEHITLCEVHSVAATLASMVPGPGHQGLCSKETTDVTESVEKRCLVHLRSVRINTWAHGQTMKLQ